MQLKRFFSTSAYKNTYGYIDSQKKYEIIRTVIYFGVSLSLFIAGYVATKSKTNLLTVVAVLGCLPASKSLVSTIMFLKHNSCSKIVHDAVEEVMDGLENLYDLVFTSEKVTFVVAHAAYRAKCLVLYSDKKVDANALEAHIQEYMKRANISGVNVKVYTDLKKYTERLQQLGAIEREEGRMAREVVQLLKDITL